MEPAREQPKPDSKYRGWFFTLCNYTDTDVQRMRDMDTRKVKYLVVGRETAGTGTPHLQGYMWTCAGIRFAAARKLVGERAAIFVARGSHDQATVYCTKEDPEPIIVGEKPSGQGARTDLSGAIESMREGGLKRVCDEAPEVFVKFHRGLERLKQRWDMDRGRLGGVRCVWLWGSTGVGKSFCARRVATSLSVELYTKPHGKWWENYDQQQMVLMDDYRNNHYAFAQLLQVIDQYPMQVEVKGAYANLAANLFIITSCNNIQTEFQCEKDECMEQMQRRCLELHVSSANRDTIFDDIEQYFGEVMEVQSLNGEESE